MSEDRYFDLQSASAYSSLGISTIRAYIRSAGLPSFRVKGKILIKRSEFDAWIESFRIKKEDDLAQIVDETVQQLLT